MSSISRRQFCGSLLKTAALVSASAWSSPALAEQMTIVKNSEGAFPDVGTLLLPMTDNRLAILKPHINKFSIIDLPEITPHSVVLNPLDKNLCAVLGRRGVTLVDIENKKNVGHIKTLENTAFSGHGCIDSRGAQLILSRKFKGEYKKGQIAIFDLKSLKEISSFQTEGFNIIVRK